MTSIARQPNGFICIFDTESKKILAYNLTDVDYIQYRMDEARKLAQRELSEDRGIRGAFCLVEYCLTTDDEDEVQNNIETLREMGDFKVQPKDLLID